jgi:hypothetical protein
MDSREFLSTASYSGSLFSSPAVLQTTSNPVRDQLMPPQSSKRSCVACANRKIKCDRSRPCGRCRRFGAQCVFPGPRRGRNAAQGSTEDQLRRRLGRLEGLINDLCGGSDVEEILPPSQRPPRSRTLSNYRRPSGKETGRLVLSKDASRYVSSAFWVALGDDVGSPLSKVEQLLIWSTDPRVARYSEAKSTTQCHVSSKPGSTGLLSTLSAYAST